MERRQFFSFMGKAAAMLGLASLVGQAQDFEFPELPVLRDAGKFRFRMRGSACYDHRLMAKEPTAAFSREIFGDGSIAG